MKKILEVFTKSEKETQQLARTFAKEILKLKSPRAVVVGLEGELGAGKTAFAKGFALGLGIKEEMKSPTFILMRVFAIPKTKNQKSKTRFFHIDAWRDRIDFREFLTSSQNILLIEWSDRVQKLLPKNYFRFVFKILGKNQREIILWR